jgi:uncharacterized protein (DUF1778 family)
MATSPQRVTVTKDQRVNIRATPSEKALVDQAARATHMGVSQFMLQAALREAEDVLADQIRFVLPTGAWAEFTALLDRPARTIPALRKAASKASPFGGR